MSPFWADIATKVAAAAALGVLTHLYNRGKKLVAEYENLVAEHARMRTALIVLLDERRRELWGVIDEMSVGTTPEQSLRFTDIIARKDRVDRIRDAEWRAAGCPREPLHRGME